jgi:penicillin-binding protein 1A
MAILRQLAHRRWLAYTAKFKPMNAVVRIVLRALLAVAVFAVLVASVCFCWFYFYSGDIPHFSELTELAPDSVATARDRCSGSPIQVIPSASVGKNLRNALRAAEGLNDEILALQVSRNLFCNSPMRMLKRHLLEYKAAVQMRRRFTPEQLVTIYLNQAPFGQGLVGAENASMHFYGKHASDLDIAQAAMIAGLLKSPTMYSPERHPDHAKERRDLVIQGMLRSGTITTEQAEAAEQSGLR